MSDFYSKQRANIAYHKLRLLIADALIAADRQGVTDLSEMISGAIADAGRELGKPLTIRVIAPTGELR